jgi:hypothetical protein
VSKTSRSQRHALWRDRVRRQQASGLTIAQFCARERCAVSPFYIWKRRLQLLEPSDQCPTLPTRSAFLPVTVRVQEGVAGQPHPIEADLPNGVCLRIPTTNVHLACRIVQAVAEARTHAGGAR